MSLKASPFLHEIALDEVYTAFYNSLNLELTFLRNDFINACKKGDRYISFDTKSSSILETLSKMELLIPEDSDGYETYNSYVHSLDHPSINILYLLLTDACNLRCKYCYFMANIEQECKFLFMPEETAKKAINMFGRSIKKSLEEGYNDQQIVIYGGEPTLNKGTLIFALQHIYLEKEKGILPKHVAVTINTNGIKLDSEILDYAKKLDATVAISIDGPPEVHDRLRVYPDGKPTLNDVVEKYKLARSKEVKIGICCTVDEHNLGNLPNVLNWLSNNLEIKGMGFNILIENKRDQSDEEYMKYSKATAKELIDCFVIARKKGIYEDRMMRRVKNFVEKTPVFSDCGGCGLQVVVAPDGQVGVCQAFYGSRKYFVSEPLESFEAEKHPYWKEWRRRSPFLMEECKRCIAFGNCGGGCPYNSYKRKGSIWELDERFCVHAKSSVEFLIKDLWINQLKKENK